MIINVTEIVKDKQREIGIETTHVSIIRNGKHNDCFVVLSNGERLHLAESMISFGKRCRKNDNIETK